MKKTTSSKSIKKNVKAVKRGKPKAAKLVENKDNINITVTPTATPTISENIVAAASIEEAVIEAKNIQTEAVITESTENLSTPNIEQNSAYETSRDSVSYSDITAPENKNSSGFYIGLAFAISVIIWVLFI